VRVPVLALLLFVILAGAPASATGLEEPVPVGYRVAVVVFDPQGVVDRVVLEGQVSERLDGLLGLYGWLEVPGYGNLTLDVRVDVDYYYPDPWLVEGLTRALQQLYTGHGVPEWAPGWVEPPGGYAWLDVLEAYWAVWDWATRAVEAGGGDPSAYNGIVVIIGDLDGVSRVYYREAPYPYVPSGALRVEGLRAWGGLAAMTFYDLSTVVKPWPSYRVPYDTYAEPASPETEPPIWALDDPTVYVAGIVADEIAYHVVGLNGWPTPYQRLEARVLVVDFGDPETTQKVLAQIDVGEVERLTLMLAPWIDLEINVTLVQAPDALLGAYREAAGRGVPVALPYEKVYPLLEEQAEEALHGQTRIGDPGLEAAWAFLVLATPEPAYLQWQDNFNFTGYSAGWYGATTYPGWDGRVLRSGLPAVIAHELGHSLGEGHPFQLPNGTVRWLMDMQATVMSYMDYGRIAYGDVYNFSTQRLSLYQALSILAANGELAASPTGQEALDLIAAGRHAQALQLLRAALGLENALETITVTQTITETHTITTTTTITTTITKTYTETTPTAPTTAAQSQTPETGTPCPETTTTTQDSTGTPLAWALAGLGTLVGLLAGLTLRR